MAGTGSFRACLIRPGILCCLALFLAIAALAARAETPAYVGSAACTSCHSGMDRDWAMSDHARAWTLPDETTVLGDFDNATFEHGGQLTRFLRNGDRFLIETEGPDGVRRAYEVVGVAGVDPLQQYLLSPEPGRVQTYDIAWDVEGARWFPVFPDQVAPPGDGFHWTGPYKNWDGRCAECHATGYTRNYSPATDSFAPQMAEIGVGCEACHGPGAAHVAWAENRDGPALAAELAPVGLTADLGASQDAEVMQCLTCHSRRQAMGDGNPVPGGSYHDAFSIALLRPGLYHPDGSIRDEVFEGGSFLQSKMFGMGVRCSDCHDPHTATLRAEGNAVCTQCHSPAGNPRFPSLPLKVFDGPEHHFHPDGSAGAQCVSCHMIQRTYMGVDERRDHSFRVPRPDLADTGSPDACTDCHADRTADWATAEIAARFPDSTHRTPHFATAFSAAWISPQPRVADLLAIAEGKDRPGIVRATALELVGSAVDNGSTARVSPLLADPDPLVRAAAAGALGALAPQDRLALLRPLLSDPSRSVREAAARALLDAAALPDARSDPALGAALGEWQQALMLRADFPETHLQIGGAALTMRNFDLALSAFRQAVRLDPQLVDGWSIIVRLQAAMGDSDGARASLTDGLAANPQSQILQALVPSDE
jgi:predicted CXXCH cytochrome family protein